MKFLIYTLVLGGGATLVMDIWSLLRKALFGIAAPNYGLIGRWVGHMPQGRFKHDAITRSAAVRGEHWLGWSVHYLTGMVYAALLLITQGTGWFEQPRLGPALFIGLVTVLAPFLLMQPGMGSGIAAARTPNPGFARIQTVITHLIFGFGLYLTAQAMTLLPI